MVAAVKASFNIPAPAQLVRCQIKTFSHKTLWRMRMLNMFNVYPSIWGIGNLGSTFCIKIVVFRKVSVMKMFNRGKSCLTKAKFGDKLTNLEWKLDKLLQPGSRQLVKTRTRVALDN